MLGRPIPTATPPAGNPVASVVVPVLDDPVCTRLALESVLANTGAVPYEVVVIDNGSAEPTHHYLEVLAARNRQVRVIRNEETWDFASACNQGLAATTGALLVVLDHDTIVPPGWLAGLARHLDDAEIGIVAPTTNRSQAGAEIRTAYRTYGEMVSFARERRQELAGLPPVDLTVAEMFCAAFRREVFDAVGPLDERSDGEVPASAAYADRVRDAGYRVVYVEELFVHCFGQASLGRARKRAAREGSETAVIYEFARPADARAQEGSA